MPPPGGRRPVLRRRPHPARQQPQSPEPVRARAPVNWLLVGIAAGLGIAAALGLVLFCTASRRSAPSPEVAINQPPIDLAIEAGPNPVVPAPVASEPAPETATSAPAPEKALARPAPAPVDSPAGFAKAYGEPAPFRFKRRDLRSADELSRQLLTMPEVDLDAAPGTAARLLAAGRLDRPAFTHPVLEPLLRRADLHGLPVAMGADCMLGKESAENLQVLSRKLRAHLSLAVPADGIDIRLDAGVLRQRLLEGRTDVVARAPNARKAPVPIPTPAEAEAVREDWLQEDALPTLVQLLQAEDRPIRLLLVDLLARIKCRAASAALVQRALFDLSAEVREVAVRALRDRPPEEYRQRLLDGLRYPWAPAADHAAEALVALGDRAALPPLAALLDEPDPTAAAPRTYQRLDPAQVWTSPRPSDSLTLAVVAVTEPGPEMRRTSLLPDPNESPLPVPVTGRQVYAVREVVRVNHLRNCLLCHAPAASPADPVRGLMPTPGQALPPPFSTPYYDGQSGNFVRADVTYLRQDFSVPQPVARAGAWPTYQRYDYLVRTRYPTDAELHRDPATSYPQREAIRWALRELAGTGEAAVR
jgi:hypothetical protein